jgi:glutathione peroxidase
VRPAGSAGLLTHVRPERRLRCRIRKRRTLAPVSSSYVTRTDAGSGDPLPSEDNWMKSLVAGSLALALGTLAVAGNSASAADKPKPKRAVVTDVVKEPTTEAAKSGPLDFKVKDIDGKEVNLADYKGKVVMMVNVASKCGNTKQYGPLQAMHEKYKDKGLVIIGFPANEFGGQEPGAESQIKEFCTSKFGVSFPMMSKIVVKGQGIHPLYAWLTDKNKTGEFGGEIEWNFAKFIIDRNGNVIGRLAARTQPDDPKAVAAIEKALAAEPAKSEQR